MNVTALLAHPDDELMCAGTLAKCVERGNRVLLLTCFVDERVNEWEACAKALELWNRGFLFADLGHEDVFAWTRRDVIAIEDAVPETDLLISHRAEDANTSHGHLGRIARTLARKNRCSLWEIDQSLPGGIDPDCPPPNHFVDITSTIERKRSAVLCYKSQIDRYPGWQQAIYARDRLYGWQLNMSEDFTYAEGFRIHKSVWL